MKKKRKIVIIVTASLLAVGIFIGVFAIRSPEFALIQIAGDIQEAGVDGLMPHLTGDAEKVVSKIKSIYENKLVNYVSSFFNKSDYVGVLQSELEAVEWNLDDVLKGRKKAYVILGFNYKDEIVGTIEVKMIREKDGWKINGINLPDFEKVEFKSKK